MNILNTSDSILLIIDVQGRLLDASFNIESVRKNSAILAKSANLLDIPVFVTEQYPQGLGETIPEIKEALPKSSKIYNKLAFNAVLDMDLLADLKSLGRKDVILFGIETHICVYQTALGLLEAGFNVHIAKDACGTRFLDSSVTGIKCMREAGAQIKSCEMIVFELLKTAKHPKFKEIQALLK